MRLCIIFGGEGSEYFVSLHSASSILRAIDKAKYEITKIGITRDGKWYKTTANETEIENDSWQEKSEKIYIDLEKKALTNSKNQEIEIDKALFAMHGDFGENGTLPAVFDMLGIAFAGCDHLSSALGYNKYLSKLIAKENGVPICDFFLIEENDLKNLSHIYEKARGLGYPLFVKPTESGSSFGITKVEKERELLKSIEEALKYSKGVLLERAISGYECEIGALELNGKITFSPVGRIIYKSDYYDYNTKYNDKRVEYEIPAKIDTGCAKLIEKYAKIIFLSLGCRTLARIDFFVTKNGEVIFNEINTMPGFTKSSMYPMLFAHAKIPFSALIDEILADKSAKKQKNHKIVEIV